MLTGSTHCFCTPRCRSQIGCVALVRAVQAGGPHCLEAMQLLHSKGALLDGQDQDGRTALHQAIRYNRVAETKWLVGRLCAPRGTTRCLPALPGCPPACLPAFLPPSPSALPGDGIAPAGLPALPPFPCAAQVLGRPPPPPFPYE